MVFRRENKSDAFQRQISALRQQLGPNGEQALPADAAATGPGGESATGSAPFSTDRRTEASSYGGRGDAAFSFSGFGDSSPAASFSSAPDVVTPPTTPVTTVPEVDAQTSVIAHDATWKGELQTDGSIHVHGRLEGSLSSRRDVFVAEEATVDATISAVNVVVAGRVTGAIRCESRFEALPQGRVAADVQAPTLVVHEGASITGGFRMGDAGPAAEAQPAPIVHRRAARSGA